MYCPFGVTARSSLCQKPCSLLARLALWHAGVLVTVVTRLFCTRWRRRESDLRCGYRAILSLCCGRYADGVIGACLGVLFGNVLWRGCERAVHFRPPPSPAWYAATFTPPLHAFTCRLRRLDNSLACGLVLAFLYSLLAAHTVFFYLLTFALCGGDGDVCITVTICSCL
jgi:hypothetical protein